MKKYITPSAEKIELAIADIITVSAPDDRADDDNTVVAPNDWFN